MKKVILTTVLLCLYSISQAQVGVFYIDGDNDIKLTASRITGNKVGNIAGAYLTFGLSSANNNKVIEGKASETTIKDRKPTFKIIFGNDRNIGYALSNVSNMEKIVLVRLHEKGKSRNLRTGKYGLVAGVQTGLNDDDIIPLIIDDVDDHLQLVKPKEQLKKGGYCFYYAGETPEGEKEFNSVFDFSIK